MTSQLGSGKPVTFIYIAATDNINRLANLVVRSTCSVSGGREFESYVKKTTGGKIIYTGDPA